MDLLWPCSSALSKVFGRGPSDCHTLFASPGSRGWRLCRLPDMFVMSLCRHRCPAIETCGANEEVSVPLVDIDFCPKQLKSMAQRALFLYGDLTNWWVYALAGRDGSFVGWEWGRVALWRP